MLLESGMPQLLAKSPKNQRQEPEPIDLMVSHYLQNWNQILKELNNLGKSCKDN